MSDVIDLLCCLPVLLLWFGPLLLVTVCLAAGGCSCPARRLRGRPSCDVAKQLGP